MLESTRFLTRYLETLSKISRCHDRWRLCVQDFFTSLRFIWFDYSAPQRCYQNPSILVQSQRAKNETETGCANDKEPKAELWGRNCFITYPGKPHTVYIRLSYKRLLLQRPTEPNGQLQRQFHWLALFIFPPSFTNETSNSSYRSCWWLPIISTTVTSSRSVQQLKRQMKIIETERLKEP